MDMTARILIPALSKKPRPKDVVFYFIFLVIFQQRLKPRLFALHAGMHIDQYGFTIGI